MSAVLIDVPGTDAGRIAAGDHSRDIRYAKRSTHSAPPSPRPRGLVDAPARVCDSEAEARANSGGRGQSRRQRGTQPCRGVVQCDGYAAYKGLDETRITLAFLLNPSAAQATSSVNSSAIAERRAKCCKLLGDGLTDHSWELSVGRSASRYSITHSICPGGTGGQAV